jgi:hypothetical protein
MSIGGKLPFRFGQLMVVSLGLLAVATVSHAEPVLSAEELIKADSQDIQVEGYSVPCFCDWNADGRPDLLVGEGGGIAPTGRIRVYLNVGVPGAPAFAGFTYVQDSGGDLAWPAYNCLGLFPRVLDWDGDGRQDLLVGTGDGLLRLYLNVGTAAAPAFAGGSNLQVGPAGDKTDIDVGSLATPASIDWDGDGRRDLICGTYMGHICKFINEGSDTAPDYQSQTLVPADGGILQVPSYRSSPCVQDLDADGKKDILTGNTEGQLLFYSNQGTDAQPDFSGYVVLEAGGQPIDLTGSARSRPCLCDWTGDGTVDVLVGANDGKVRLYQGVPDLSAADPSRVSLLAVRPPYPNPANPRVTISFALHGQAAVELTILDARGALVRRLFDDVLPAGDHRLVWKGDDAGGRPAATGVYLYRLACEGLRQSGRIVLLR